MPEARINCAANAAPEPPHPLNGNRALHDSASHRHRLPACHLTQPDTASTRPSVNMVGVFQPKYAAYLNLIEPWWKVLRSLALKGRRFEAWAEIEQAVERATAYWNQHKHPFIWGRRRRHRTPRRLGVAAPPNIALI